MESANGAVADMAGGPRWRHPPPILPCDWVSQSRGGGGEEKSARNGGIRGVLGAQGAGGGIHLRAVTPRTLPEKLLSNPHSTLRRAVHFFEPMAEKENTSYSRGEKWWDSEGVKKPILTAQPPLLDGAEGELLSPAATLTVEGITAGESNNRITAATRIGGGGHEFAVPSHGSTAGTPGPEDANLPYGPLTPSAISAGAVIDPPPVLFSGLEPPRLETTGERVTGADTPKLRIENKRRRRVLLASQQPQTQWSVYQGDFDLPDPVAPL